MVMTFDIDVLIKIFTFILFWINNSN